MNSDATGVFVIVLVILVYFVPSFVAFGRERNGGVIVLNLFLGWTLLGWVIALAWAASLPRKTAVNTTYGPSGESVSRGAHNTPTIGDDHSWGAIKPEAQTVLCPFCAEEIKPAAIVCKHCGRDLPKLG